MLLGVLDANCLVPCDNPNLPFEKPSEKENTMEKKFTLGYLIHILVPQIPSLVPKLSEHYIHMDLRPKGLCAWIGHT